MTYKMIHGEASTIRQLVTNLFLGLSSRLLLFIGWALADEHDGPLRTLSKKIKAYEYK